MDEDQRLALVDEARALREDIEALRLQVIRLRNDYHITMGERNEARRLLQLCMEAKDRG